jgi:hypothetical protein
LRFHLAPPVHPVRQNITFVRHQPFSANPHVIDTCGTIQTHPKVQPIRSACHPRRIARRTSNN